MGVKRPLEEKDFPELSFKQPKQLDNDIKLTFMTDDLSSHKTTQTVDSPGETKTNCCELHSDGTLENGVMNDSYKELEASSPLPLVTSSSSSSEEDTGNEGGSFMYNFPGYVDLSIPWRPPELHDTYTILLNSSPRKEIPVGPEHQAEVPECVPISSRKDISENAVDSDWEQKMIGTCVIPLPTSDDHSSIDGVAVGHGGINCNCLDIGSMRCVQQHVNEAREKLRETLGEEAFTKLGFYDMGEEVASKWIAEDEQLFHEVVFSHPASLGEDFWKHLSDAFPYRSKKELVSYYFNVFMLRRRAIQNRSYLLQIDSDDDEDHNVGHSDRAPVDEDSDNESDLNNIHGNFYVEMQEDDSAVESFGDADWADEYQSEPVNVAGYEYLSEPVSLPGFEYQSEPILPSYDAKDNICAASSGNGNGNDSSQQNGGAECGSLSEQETKK